MLTHSWLDLPDNTDFSLHNLPYGIFSTATDPQLRVGVAIGAFVLDLAAVAELGLFDDITADKTVFTHPYLNPFITLGKAVHRQVRHRLQELLTSGDTHLRPRAEHVLTDMAAARLHMPVRIGNYTDFYSSEEHATHVGQMFRPDSPLMPNWKHLPVAYHGRASSIVLSGVPLHRPKGQIRPAENQPPFLSPTKSLDFELEVAFIIGKETVLGESIAVDKAEEYIFGFVLFNDWSARDIQRWEYQPLGPFLSKNFGSSLSPWVVTLEALESFRTGSPLQEPPVLEYLQYEGEHSFDIELEVALRPEHAAETTVCRTNFRHLYWNICQQLAHHTINGCNMQVGDLLASGTISGAKPGSAGSMLEITEGGKHPLVMHDGTERKFINDGDTVIMRGYCKRGDLRVGFGELITPILPAR